MCVHLDPCEPLWAAHKQVTCEQGSWGDTAPVGTRDGELCLNTRARYMSGMLAYCTHKSTDIIIVQYIYLVP